MMIDGSENVPRGTPLPAGATPSPDGEGGVAVSSGPLEPGTVVGLYRIEKLLGEGGMGAVYLAEHTLTSQEVAIKVVWPELMRDPNVVRRFLEEARVMGKFQHPNIVPLLNFFDEGGRYFLVMAYIEGRALDAVLEEGPLPVAEAARVSKAVLSALDYAHGQAQPVVHRDIKPANIMLRKDGHVFVTDFGVAKALGREKLTRTAGVVGTYEYMSPEQVEGQEVSPATDQYAFGITLYKMLTGVVPFPQETEGGFECMKAHLERSVPAISDYREGLSTGLQAVVGRALAKVPSERFGSAAGMGEALEAAVVEKAEPPPPEPPPEPPPPPPGEPAESIPPPDKPPGGSGYSGLGKLVMVVAGAVVLAVVLAVVFAGGDKKDEKNRKGEWASETAKAPAGELEFSPVAGKSEELEKRGWREICEHGWALNRQARLSRLENDGRLSPVERKEQLASLRKKLDVDAASSIQNCVEEQKTTRSGIAPKELDRLAECVLKARNSEGFASCERLFPRKGLKKVLTLRDEQKLKDNILSELPSGEEIRVINANFDDKVMLLGYQVTANRLKPGGSTSLTLYWKSLAKVDEHFKIAVHLDSSRARKTYDHYAIKGLYPTKMWEPGEIVRDSFEITVDSNFPIGPAKLWVNLFDVTAWRERKESIRLAVKEAGKCRADKAHRLLVTSFMIGDVEEKRLTLRRASGPIAIDGAPDEPAWAGAFADAGRFYKPDGNALPSEDATEAGFLYDNDNLYVAWQVADSDIQTPYKTRDSTLWSGGRKGASDVVEFFLDPDGDGEDYLELQVSPADVVFDARFASYRSPAWKQAAEFDLDFRHGVKVDGTLNDSSPDRGYSIEMAIPWKEIPGLDGHPNPGQAFSANLFRLSNSGTWAAAWSPVGNDFHDFSMAGVLTVPAGEKWAKTREEEPAQPAAEAGKPGPAVVLLETSMGDVKLELTPDRTPKTVANFLEYVNKGFYNGTVFHRVVPGFVIQGGGFTADLAQKSVGDPIENEAANALPNSRGTICMARTRARNSATSQFYINLKDNPMLNYRGERPSGWGYCVFGRVIEGMDVVDRIGSVETGPGGAFRKDVPVESVLITKVAVVD